MSDPTRRGAIAALALAALLGLLFARDAFATTVLRCRHRASGSRCSVSESQLGLDRGTTVIADLQGAYVEDEGFDRAEPRLVLQGKGGDVPLASSASWSHARQREAAAQLVRFAGAQGELQFEERHAFARAWAVIACVVALLWVAWPRSQRVQPEEVEQEDLQPRPWATRLLGALMLRRVRYREIAEDRASTWPAFAIVALVALIVGYADGLGGSALMIDGEAYAPSVANANLRALAAAAAACVSWPAAAVITSWLAAGRDGVRTLELLRALGFANLFHLLSLLQFGGLLAWPLFFVAAYVATRGVCSAGRIRSFIAAWFGQGFALLLAIPLWLALLSLGSP